MNTQPVSDRRNVVREPGYVAQVARINDDAELAYVMGVPRYGGHPSKLANPAHLQWAKTLLLAGWNSDQVASELGYAQDRNFSDAFLRLTGERPGAFQTRHGVAWRVRRGGHRCLRKRKIPDRTGQVPLPTYAAARRAYLRRRRNKAQAMTRRMLARERKSELVQGFKVYTCMG